MESNQSVEKSYINTMSGDRRPNMGKKENGREIEDIEWQVMNRNEGSTKERTGQRMLHPIIAIVVQP